MPLRPGRCYRHFGTPPYTRKEYIRSIPPVQIPKFEFGNPKGSFNAVLKLITKEAGQIRMNALEAARRVSNKYLSSRLGDNSYYLKLMVYPHHILRENKMMATAGADRLQDGMRQAFGTPIGRAARVRAGQVVFLLKINKERIAEGKEALKRAASKLSIPTRIVVEELREALSKSG